MTKAKKNKTVAKAKPTKSKKPVAKILKKIAAKFKTKSVKAKAPAKKPAAKKVVKPVAKKAPAKVMAKKPAVAALKPVVKPIPVKIAAAPVAAARPAHAPVPQARPNMMAPRMVQNQRPQSGHIGGQSPLANRPMMGRPGAPVVMRPSNDTPVENFRTGDYVVYPAHGVGTIEGVETQSIAGMSVTLYAISFEKDRMRLKIPVQKAQTAGLRKLSSGDRLKDALKTLTGKAKIKRTMWSRRAQEYEAKINSGDPVQIAEVLRDLRRPKDDTEQSYSERQIYQSALERLAREVAAVQRIAEAKAVEHLETVLAQAA